MHPKAQTPAIHPVVNNQAQTGNEHVTAPHQKQPGSARPGSNENSSKSNDCPKTHGSAAWRKYAQEQWRRKKS